MEIRFVPDAPGAWVVYDLGTLVLALPPELRAVADAIAASPHAGVADVLAALRSSGLADGAPFAVLDGTPDGVHVALRGPATVGIGAATFTGLGAEPWLERRIPDVAVVRLTVPGGEWTFALGSDASTAASAPPPAPPAVAPPAVAPPPLLDARQEITEVPRLEETTATDDSTVVVDEIARLRAKRSAGIAPPILTSAPAASARDVDPTPPQPRLSLELPDGMRQPIDSAVLIGRSPGLSDGTPYRVVRFADGDISRNHAHVAVEGGTVVVTDLGSRNGTTVRIPGRPALTLRRDEPTPVLPDTVIDLGGGIELVVRED